jgi:sugar phosphate isomerase/epimerase
MTTLRLGINTCFAVKRWPSADEWTAVVSEELGLDLVQHSLDLVDLSLDAAGLRAEAATIRAACEHAGVAIGSTFTGLAAYSAPLMLGQDASSRARAENWYERVIAFSADLGAAMAGGHVGSLSIRDHADRVRSEALWADLQAALGRLAQGARAAGLESLVVENMACAREPATMEQIQRLLAPGDATRVPVALCLDVGHMCVPGTTGDDRDPYAWLRRFGTHAPIVHLQQSDAEGDHHWPFTAAANAAGRIEPARVLEALADSGAERADLILEIIPPFEQDDRQVLDDLIESVEHWRAALGRVGSAG